MRRLPAPAALVLLALAAAGGCGLNSKDSGGSVPGRAGGAKGTLECLVFCHQIHAASATSPAGGWAAGFHVAPAAGGSITLAEAKDPACSSCHDPRQNFRWQGDDPVESDFREQERAYLTSGGPLGPPARPFVGCEACHGSGTLHYLFGAVPSPASTWTYAHGSTTAGTWLPSPAYTVRNTFADKFAGIGCACHAPSRHAGSLTAGVQGRLTAQHTEWFGGDGPGAASRDGHSDASTLSGLQGMMTSAKPSGPCVSCHTVEGFVRQRANGEALTQAEIDRIAGGTKGASQVSCVACHPSHRGRETLRSVGDPLAASTAARLCFACHNLEGVAARVVPGQLGSTPYHPQREMLLGTGGWRVPGFAWSGTPSRHAFGHAGYAPTLRAGCISCHLRPVHDAPLAAFPQRVTSGHRFAPRVDACAALCHPRGDGLLGFVGADGIADDLPAYAFTNPADYLFGGARVPGRPAPTQAEVGALLSDLRGRLELRGAPWDPARQLFRLESMAGMSSTLRGAAWNYDFVAGDRSLGLHNPAYARALLSASVWALP